MTRTALRRTAIAPSFLGGAIRFRSILSYCQRPFGIAACAVLYNCPALREPPQHGKPPRRNDFLERRIAWAGWHRR